MQGASHFIITHFHTTHPARDYLGSDAWLRHRIPIFERYCLPSVLNQTRRDFTWVLLCSSNSPQWLVQYLQDLPLANKKVVPLDVWATSDAIASLIADMTTDDLVITTRLDSDDAVANTFIDRTRAIRNKTLPYVVNPLNGLRLSSSGLLKARDPGSPFATMYERRRNLQTVYCQPHHDLYLDFDVYQIEGSVEWMQVIHDRNLANVAAGLPTSARHFNSAFPGLEDVPRWNPLSYLRETRPDRVLSRRLRHRFQRPVTTSRSSRGR